jgi:hypothetical protein
MGAGRGLQVGSHTPPHNTNAAKLAGSPVLDKEYQRPHMGLTNDAPEPRAVESPDKGRVVAIPQVGGLHHRYARCA